MSEPSSEAWNLRECSRTIRRRISSSSFFADIAQLCVESQVKPLGNLPRPSLSQVGQPRLASLVSRPMSKSCYEY